MGQRTSAGRRTARSTAPSILDLRIETLSTLNPKGIPSYVQKPAKIVGGRQALLGGRGKGVVAVPQPILHPARHVYSQPTQELQRFARPPFTATSA